jgi:hypothetical protein
MGRDFTPDRIRTTIHTFEVVGVGVTVIIAADPTIAVNRPKQSREAFSRLFFTPRFRQG